MSLKLTGPVATAMALAISSLAALSAQAADPKQAPEAPAGAASAAAAKPATPPAAPDASEPKPFDKVITAEAKTQTGLFNIHSLKGKTYFEIPKALLSKPLLMVATATAVPANVDHVGKELNTEVVRFTQQGNRVYLQVMSHAFVADPSRPIAPSVDASQRDTIVLSFPVEAFAKSGAPVIEVTRLFNSEVGDFSARGILRGNSVDPSRSYIDTTKAFAGSLRIDAVHTYGVTPAPVILPPGLPPGFQLPPQPPKFASVNVAYNLVQLPETPMQPRIMDDRVGFFSIGRVDFGSDAQESKRERLITRWRLEKKDPAAALSEPVKPIVWYIDSSTPSNLVPYVKKGIEAWNVAFEAAGFKNAVQARTFPTKEEDPEFDPADVRYSIIRWVPSPIANAYGPHLSDPRSGEILNANIVMYHNIMQLQRDWYVTQAGAVDPRAQQLPLPDDLMGELVGYVVTHEVGHSLGFPHNMKASSTYPVDKLRDAKWLKEMGHVPTLMDYSRINYVVQPEDKIDPALLIPKIGPYDIFATQWGYTPIPEAKTAAAEKPVLDRWIREQDSKPWLRFTSPKGEGEYGDTTEAVGDADAVYSTGLGIKNLQRIVKQLPKMALKDGESDKPLEDLYRATWGQWGRELGHVTAIVGGYNFHNKHGGQAGAVHTPATKAKQAQAVAFLNEQLFKTPSWLFEPAILERVKPAEPGAMLLTAQRNTLRALLDRARTTRLLAQEAAAADAAKAYRVDELLGDLRGGVFTELNQPGAKLSVPRRNLQRAYVELLSERLLAAGASGPDEAKPAIRAELKGLKSLFSAKASGSGDKVLRAHLDELADTATKALDPRNAPSTSAAATPPTRPGFEAESAANGVHQHTEACWPQLR
ncbi:zinc-dependent metalloprotease [Roseateles sp.]|uniref:zinc-dependent metalloprotease n=1 Tax=Roseateles sp. TaxID=1971397 RepID=UPI003D132ECF